jgi:hypothetical protein
LTRTGWAAFRLGLHRRFVDHLPEPVAAKLRALRKAFYRRIYESETEA